MYGFQDIAAPVRGQSSDAANLCPHGHGICYCHYIQVQGLLGSFYAKAESVDEVFVCSYFYALVLYRKVQIAELSGVAYALGHHLLTTREAYDDMLKRLGRCIELDGIMIDMGDIMRQRVLLNDAPDLRFRFDSAELGQSGYFLEIQALTGRVERMFELLKPLPGLEPIHRKARSSLQAHAFQWQRLAEDFGDVLRFIRDKGNGESVAYGTVVPEAELAGYSDRVLARHHPAALSEAFHASDELNFIAAHETFEVWFPSLITALFQAVALLHTHRPADTFQGAQYIWRAGALFRLFARMIAVPQTMSASDYIKFRGELRGGSGAESIQFRAIELLMGLRDPQYVENMRAMHLMTPELQRLWDSSSLNDAIVQLLMNAGIIAKDDRSETRAQKIAQEVMKPTGRPNSHADIMEVLEAAVDLEQKRELWQRHHIAMVQRMIGNRPSVGVAGETMKGKETAAMAKMPHSMPYLQKTLMYQRIFPDVWNARDYLQENWEVVPISWR